MTNFAYDPEADAGYVRFSDAKVASTEHAGPFIYDVDADGRIIGIEILSCSKVLAPGRWHGRRPSERKIEAAE